MKKFLLIAMAVMTGIMAMAETKTYTDQLVVTINGVSSDPQETAVDVEFQESGNINFILKNFNLGGDINVGNIIVEDLPVAHGRRFDTFLFKGKIDITPGDIEGVAEDEYLGPIISPVPLKLAGKISGDKLYVSIDIDMRSTLGEMIFVSYGTDFPEVPMISTKQYTDDLIVTINEESSDPQETTVIVETLENGDINFVLKNFSLGGSINVGNIVVKELMLSEGHGYKTLSFQGNIDITSGDVEGVAEDEYLGPFISPIPLLLDGKLSDDKLYVNIGIDMQAQLGQIIYVKFGSDIKPVYTVTYVLDGEVLSTEQVEEGGTVTLPEAPEKEGYTFAGWTGAPDTVTDDVTITGSYTINTYTVTYVIDGETLSSETVEYGGTVTLPEAPEKEGYTFEGWTGVPDAVTGDVTITGSYSVNTYTIFFVVDDEVVYQEEVAYGAAVPNFDYTPEIDERYTRTFEGWDGEKYDTMPAHDVTYTAIITVVDGIRAVGADTADAVVYDLSGRRFQRVTKAGIYIVNGKRVVLK